MNRGKLVELARMMVEDGESMMRAKTRPGQSSAGRILKDYGERLMAIATGKEED